MPTEVSLCSSLLPFLLLTPDPGIGRAITSIYLRRSNTTLIAAVRDPNHETVKTLKELPRGANSSLIVTTIDSTVAETASSAISDLQKIYQISKLDTVIANAGIGEYYVPTALTDIEEVRKHYEVNTIGPLVLFQATLPLLRAAGKGSKFIIISSILGSIGAMEKVPLPTGAYGASKSAVNFLAKKIHQEHPELVVVPVHPGYLSHDPRMNSGTDLLI